LISLISASIDEQLIVIVGGGGVRIAFLEIFAINHAADSRLARSKQRNEKAYDKNATKHPNGPIVTGSKEPRLEEIAIQENAHSCQDARARGCIRRALLRRQESD